MRIPMFAGLLATGLALALTSPSRGADTMDSGRGVLDDSRFVKKAANIDMYEIEAAKLAQTKTARADIKNYASRMVKDHTATEGQLKSATGSNSELKLPKEMGKRHKALIAELRGKNGKDFDELYLVQEINSHNAAVMLFTREGRTGKDPDVKKFAAETLPMLTKHLSMAQGLRKGGAAP